MTWVGVGVGVGAGVGVLVDALLDAYGPYPYPTLTSGSEIISMLSPSTSSMPASTRPCWRAVITTHLKTCRRGEEGGEEGRVG